MLGASFYLLSALMAVAGAANFKRGMLSDIGGPTYEADANKFTSPAVTALSWYYSFGQYPDSKFSKRYEFVMQQFGVKEQPEADGNNFQNLKTLMGEVDKTRPRVLLTFLEPALTGISPEAAVAAWRKYIIPIKRKYPKMKIGSPSVINGPDSEPWIRKFISQCPECKFDFLDVHYYWTYNEFQNEIQRWRKLFPNKNMWVSDIGFQGYTSTGTDNECKGFDSKCVDMIKKHVTWMDQTNWIVRYTFRGEFRTTGGREAHQPFWSFLDDNGNFTPLGKWYLGVK